MNHSQPEMQSSHLVMETDKVKQENCVGDIKGSEVIFFFFLLRERGRESNWVDDPKGPCSKQSSSCSNVVMARALSLSPIEALAPSRETREAEEVLSSEVNVASTMEYQAHVLGVELLSSV